GMIRPCVAEDVRTRDHSLLEFLREGRERRLVHTQRPQPVPGEGDGGPPGLGLDRWIDSAATDSVDEASQPFAPLGCFVNREKRVLSRSGSWTGQQKMLDVIELEHRACSGITASGRACARTPS